MNGRRFALTLAAVVLGAVRCPLQATEGLEAAFGDLLRQPAYAAALRTEVLGDLKISRLLSDSFAESEAMRRFVVTWEKDYACKQGGLYGHARKSSGTVTSFKAKQRTVISLFHRRLTDLDMATVETAQAGKWLEWTLLARGMLFVVATIPQFSLVAGMELDEGEELLKLRLLAHKATLRRQREWRQYLSSKGSLPDPLRKEFNAGRTAWYACETYLRSVERNLASEWKRYQMDSPLWSAWRKYSETGGGDSQTIQIGPKEWDLQGSRTGLVAYVYVLAETLRLGTIHCKVDGLGFDAEGLLSAENPILRPRMRLHVTFTPENSPAITVTDLRLFGEPIDLRNMPFDNVKVTPEDGLKKLTASGQDNAEGRQASIWFWKGENEPGTNPKWRGVWRKRVRQILEKENAEELSSITGDIPAIRDCILKGMQAEMKRHLESQLAKLASDPRFRQCRKDRTRLAETIRVLRGDGKAILSPERVAFNACQRRFDDWSAYVGAFLPQPRLGHFDRHPWPRRLPPQLLPCLELVDEAMLPAWRELDRLQIVHMANGNRSLQRVLEAIAYGLDPARSDFRAVDFQEVNAMHLAENSSDYEYTQEVEVDGKEIVRLYLMAAEKGHSDAMARLGFIYRYGMPGVDRDANLAAIWSGKAIDRGSTFAMTILGHMYATGEGVDRDVKEAVRLYRLAADNGDTDAAYKLGWRYANPQEGVPDDEEAVRWYRIAADQGEPRALNNLGFMYQKGRGVQANDGKAAHWYQLGAERGNPMAMFNLALLYEDGKGIKADYAKAVAWYRKAAEKDLVQAIYNLARLTAHGLGVDRDDQEAIRLLRKVAKLGDGDGPNMLARIEMMGLSENVQEAMGSYRKLPDQSQPGLCFFP